MRLIFDIDNTLIIWKKKYLSALRDTIAEYNLNLDYKKVNNLIENYESYHDKYDKEEFIKYLSENTKTNITLKFIDDWFIRLSKCASLEEGLIDTLEYLSKKYELVILTNWFIDMQIDRLKYIGIDKYFIEFYGGEEYIKPNKEAFKKAIGNKSIDECIMIGDNYDIDIKGALDLGMKAILISNIKRDNCITIKNINELKEIL